MKLADSRIVKRRYLLIGVALIIAVLIKLYTTPEVAFVEVSPDREFRIEHFYPGALQSTYYFYIRGMEMPGFARLYRNNDDTYFGESPVIDFAPGMGTNWLVNQAGKVSVGGPDGYDFIGVKR